jgi:glucose-1-phosphate thymidylyltransferase
MKGIILAGGTGSRLFPSTKSICKQLLPIYDKPMIYYPVSTLMLAGIKEILLIVRPQDQNLFEKTLGDGSQWGISIQYVKQDHPRGLPDAYQLGESFLDGDSSMLILGDNFLYAQNLKETLKNAVKDHNKGTIFSYNVSDPEHYGVLVIDHEGKPTAVIEKPKEFVSNLAIPGLYLFDNQAPKVARDLKPSARGETEITDMIRFYLNREELKVIPFGRGTAWFDSGTSMSLLQASSFVHTIQKRQGLAIACLEEIAYHMGYIDKSSFIDLIEQLPNSAYTRTLHSLMRPV